MKDDVRYSELRFLQVIRDNPLRGINANSQEEQRIFGLGQIHYVEMITLMLEELYIEPNQDEILRLAREIRGETMRNAGIARAELFSKLIWSQCFQFRISYRGLRRIEELRDLLKQDRVLEPFKVLLDIRYFQTELADALRRDSNVPVSVLCLDMDNFKPVNDSFGHAAGDVVMKAYLEAVRDCVATFGIGFRGRGDEVVVLLIGKAHDAAVEVAETIRAKVAAIECEHAGNKLPRVTASIGVVTSPPAERSMDIESLADDRQRRAKKDGKNRVVYA